MNSLLSILLMAIGSMCAASFYCFHLSEVPYGTCSSFSWAWVKACSLQR